MILFALLSPAWATDTAHLRPRKVADQAALVATASSGAAALVTEGGEVWVGERRLRQLGELTGPPSGLHVSGGAVSAWATRREGLCVETVVQTWTLDGEERPALQRYGAPVAARAGAGRHVVLWPAHLDLIPLDGGEVYTVPLPPGQPVGLSAVDGALQVDAADGVLLRLDAEGCPVGLEDDPAQTPLHRWQVREPRRVCTAPPRLPRVVEAEAEATLELQRRIAMRDGDTDALARLGGLSCDDIEGLRPKKSDHRSAFTARFERSLQLGGRLGSGARTAAVVRSVDPAVDLDPWIRGAYAPACHARVVFEATSSPAARALKRRIAEQRERGGTCADDLVVAWPGEVSVEDEPEEGAIQRPASVLYVQNGDSWTGVRRGAASARMVRLDLARLDALDPLHGLSTAPELTPSWSKPPGPGGPVLLDVDGSWVAAAGWDLVRGPPNAIREERVALGGPVTRLRGRRDGRFEVVSGGQVALVGLEDRSVDWVEGPSPEAELLPVPDRLPPRQDVDPGPWRIVGDGRLSARTEKGAVTLDLGLPIERVLNGRIASVAVTPIGLVGLGTDGQIVWRLTEIDDWAWTDAFVVATSPWGVVGYRIPF